MAYPLSFCVHALFYSLARVIYYWYSNILNSYSSTLPLWQVWPTLCFFLCPYTLLLSRVINYWYPNILIGYSSALTLCLTDKWGLLLVPWCCHSQPSLSSVPGLHECLCTSPLEFPWQHKPPRFFLAGDRQLRSNKVSGQLYS